MLGGSPAGPELVVPVLGALGIDGEDVVLSFTAREGQSYRLESREALPVGSWESVTSVPAPAATQAIEIRDSRFRQAGHRFYRLVSP
jgi:hypothetical protein